jgi:hypothetical protein
MYKCHIDVIIYLGIFIILHLTYVFIPSINFEYVVYINFPAVPMKLRNSHAALYDVDTQELSFL